jgi:hypothetical protein
MKTRVEQLPTAELEARLYRALARTEDRRLSDVARLSKLEFIDKAWEELQRRRHRGSAANRSQEEAYGSID